MTQAQLTLISTARQKYKDIFPIQQTFSQGFRVNTMRDDLRYLIFWFNTSDNSTHAVKIRIKTVKEKMRMFN